MPSQIFSIAPNSPAAKKRVAPGDVLLSVNGHEIADVLDYRFHAANKKCILRLRRPNGKEYTVRVRKEEYEDLGLEFGDGLMDAQRRCKNRCVFCFIDQLPPGLRESLYFKDDDARLGFLFGNYITLTNLTDREVQRIIAMRLSPINVSVHTMNPALRCRMMGNPRAGESLRYLHTFAQAGLDLNVQLVLCPGLNDGEELRFTLQELLKLPSLRSVAAVPVGLTKHRERLTPLRPFTSEEASAVIALFEEFRNYQLAELCCSDEFFLLAERDMPSVDYYGEFPQLENGVGMWALFKRELLDLLEDKTYCYNHTPEIIGAGTIATGIAARPLMQFLAGEMERAWPKIKINVIAIENHFFGGQITVAGLLTGQDVIAQLRGRELGDVLLLPDSCLNADGLTLDGITLEEISLALGVPVKTAQGAEGLLNKLLGGEP